jgi:uncharacterized protein (UPF0335 family)
MSTHDVTAAKQLEERLDSELKKIKNEVDDLYETVYKGNGKPSLVTRVNTLEGKLTGLREQMAERIEHLSTENSLKFDSLHQKIENKFGRLEGWMETKFTSMDEMLRGMIETGKVDRAGGWQLKAAIVTAIAAIVGTAVTLLLR